MRFFCSLPFPAGYFPLANHTGCDIFAIVMKKKTAKTTPPTKDEYPHDRITLAVRKGYKAWLEEAALELNLDKSKMVRLALEDYIKVNRTRLSDRTLKRFEELKFGHGHGRYGESLL